MSVPRTFSTEAMLLSWIFDKIKELDPDIVIGHNIVGFTLGVLFCALGIVCGVAEIGGRHEHGDPLLDGGGSQDGRIGDDPRRWGVCHGRQSILLDVGVELTVGHRCPSPASACARNQAKW